LAVYSLCLDKLRYMESRLPSPIISSYLTCVLLDRYRFQSIAQPTELFQLCCFILAHHNLLLRVRPMFYQC
jgi:hypothetical protein